MRSLNDQLLELRNRNPHWRIPNAAYFITCRLHKSQHELSPEEKSVIANALKHFADKRYRLYAFVVMDDHFHAVCLPIAGRELSDIIHSWKSFTANKLQRKHNRLGAVWQKDYYDRIVRSEEDLIAKMEYVLKNPIKCWPDVHEYQWSQWFPDALQ